MSVVQTGSRWQIPAAIIDCLNANLQLHADRESQLLADRRGELRGDDYTGDGVLLRIPDIVSISTKMDVQAYPESFACPAVYVGGIGDTTFTSAVSTIAQQSMAETGVMIAAYVTTRAVYQGVTYRLTESELIYVAGALGGAIVSTLRSVGIGSIWSAGAGVINPTVDAMRINGHAADNDKTSAAKVLISTRMHGEMRY